MQMLGLKPFMWNKLDLKFNNLSSHFSFFVKTSSLLKPNTVGFLKCSVK